jgi:hypothetical protein
MLGFLPNVKQVIAMLEHVIDATSGADRIEGVRRRGR